LEPPDDPGADLACKEALGRLHGGHPARSGRATGRGASDGGVTTDADESDEGVDPDETTQLLKRAVISIAHNQTEERELKRAKKEESSMVGRMNRKDRELFVYLSASNWTDTPSSQSYSRVKTQSSHPRTKPHPSPDRSVVPSGEQEVRRDVQPQGSKDHGPLTRLRTGPKAPHYQSGKPRFICQKYQVLGRCVPGCYMAHVVPTDIPQVDKDIITSHQQNGPGLQLTVEGL
jgi:hypothetical protein